MGERDAATTQVGQLQSQIAALKASSDSTKIQEFRARHQEIAEALIHKQNQLDDMTTQCQALRMRHEADAKRAKDTISTLQQQVAAADDVEVEAQVHMGQQPRNFKQLKQKYKPPQAANIIDAISVFAVNILRRFPMARLVTVLYLLFLHLMMTYIMHSTHQASHHELHASSGDPASRHPSV